MNTNSYLMVTAIIFFLIMSSLILMCLQSMLILLKARAIPIYAPEQVQESVKSPIINAHSKTIKRKPVAHSDEELWEKERDERKRKRNGDNLSL